MFSMSASFCRVCPTSFHLLVIWLVYYLFYSFPNVLLSVVYLYICFLIFYQPSPCILQITHMEMIKGIQGHGYHDELVVPIIENDAHERELTESLAEAVYSSTFTFVHKRIPLYLFMFMKSYAYECRKYKLQRRF